MLPWELHAHNTLPSRSVHCVSGNILSSIMVSGELREGLHVLAGYHQQQVNAAHLMACRPCCCYKFCQTGKTRTDHHRQALTAQQRLHLPMVSCAVNAMGLDLGDVWNNNWPWPCTVYISELSSPCKGQGRSAQSQQACVLHLGCLPLWRMRSIM